MLKKIIEVITILSALATGTAHSIPTVYQCTVVDTHSLNSSGSLKKLPSTSKDTFMVNRLTGAVMGKSFSNDGERITVFDQGSEKQAFKSISINPTGYTQPSYLVIHVYGDAPDKEFMLIILDKVVTGLCK